MPPSHWLPIAVVSCRRVLPAGDSLRHAGQNKDRGWGQNPQGWSRWPPWWSFRQEGYTASHSCHPVCVQAHSGITPSTHQSAAALCTSESALNMWRCLTSHSACHVFMYTRTLTWTGLVNHQQHTYHITHCLIAPLTLNRACLMHAMVHSMCGSCTPMTMAHLKVLYSTCPAAQAQLVWAGSLSGQLHLCAILYAAPGSYGCCSCCTQPTDLRQRTAATGETDHECMYANRTLLCAAVMLLQPRLLLRTCHNINTSPCPDALANPFKPLHADPYPAYLCSLL